MRSGSSIGKRLAVAAGIAMVGLSMGGAAQAADDVRGGIAAPVRPTADGRLTPVADDVHARTGKTVGDGHSPAARAIGGPFEAATSAATAGSATEVDLRADEQFRSLFMTWKKLDSLQKGVIAIPSVQPVNAMKFTSNFGIRSDPFRGTAAMHAGVDIPGPVGTPIYATADGIIAESGRRGGYGNMVEINHGKGIATRYGHMSKLLVQPNTRVKRGQLIGLMGSTGRSTGSHLHYEVRIDGHAVNPIPFLTTADYLLAAQDRTLRTIPISTEASQD
ncbi:M23 family metallopeptidase [Sphingomonas sp. Leaf17]|uniref:M23 family metallopeptidase n=1 Tax=Sphingomonas sp. Leaf17 TaxID=1735683 RepID=UPI003FA74514